MYWLSGRTRNDLFMLYCFDDSGRSGAQLREFVARRSTEIADLSVRLRKLPGDLDYPAWVRCEFRAEQFVEHILPEPDWPSVCEVLGKLLGTGVDAAVRPWRLHVFRRVVGAPGVLDRRWWLFCSCPMRWQMAGGVRRSPGGCFLRLVRVSWLRGMSRWPGGYRLPGPSGALQSSGLPSPRWLPRLSVPRRLLGLWVEGPPASVDASV